MSKKVVKKKNVPAGSSADSSDADVVTPSELEAVASPADLDGGAPLREEDDPDDNEKPSPPHVCRAAMAEWEARMTVLAKEF
ncbi:unnamed protein product [Lampetra planeri]